MNSNQNAEKHNEIEAKNSRNKQETYTDGWNDGRSGLIHPKASEASKCKATAKYN